MSQTIALGGRQSRLILVGASLLLALGMGIRQSFGLFLEPVTHDLAVTAADFTLALAVQNIVWGYRKHRSLSSPTAPVCASR
jgi:hypothetical protein